MTNQLVIYGASNFGDEVAQLFRDTGAGWEIVGFLDDDKSKWGTQRGTLPVLGGRDWLAAHAADVELAVAIGNPAARKRVVGSIAAQYNASFAKATHPSVISSPSNQLGEGTIVMAGSTLTTSIRLGDHVIVNPGCTIGHNTCIHDFSTINPSVAIAGDVELEEGVYVGIGAIIIDKLRVARGAVVGAGATVLQDVGPFDTVVGVPARAIKTRPNDLD